MIRLFKKYFIPHKGNNHRPHILRWEAALIILSLVLLIEVLFLVPAFWIMPPAKFFATVMPEAIIAFTNQYRLESSLNSLRINQLLTKAAQLKAEDMAQKGYFSHTNPEGLTPWHWLERVGYHYGLAGENLAINFIDSCDATAAWMNSPAHRANILNNNFTEIGIGTAQGLYQGQETTFIVQFFGRPVQSAPEKQTPILNQASPPSKAQEPVIPQPNQSSELFIAVKGATQEPIVPTPTVGQPAVKNQTFLLKQWLASPRSIANYLYIVLLTIISLALLLAIFIKIKIQHPALIVNGVTLLIIISAIIWINQFLALAQAKII